MKILVIKHGALGDLIMNFGAMQQIRKHYPDAHITMLTSQPFVKMMEKSGLFNDVLVDNRPKLNLKNWGRVCQSILADGGFDMIFNLQLSKRVQKKYYTIARLLTKNPFRWAYFDNDGAKCINVDKKPRLTWGKTRMETLPIQWADGDLSCFKGEEKNFHLLPEKFVLLIPGCSATHPYKRWPASSYAELANRLADKGIRSVVLGTKSEETEINHIVQNAPTAVNFMDKAALIEIPALVQRSVAVVGNDTGPQHMAALCQRPTITLYCNITAKSAQYFPKETPLISDNIADISVDTVYEQLMQRIK